jgi:hypothetical protein
MRHARSGAGVLVSGPARASTARKLAASRGLLVGPERSGRRVAGWSLVAHLAGVYAGSDLIDGRMLLVHRLPHESARKSRIHFYAMHDELHPAGGDAESGCS